MGAMPALSLSRLVSMFPVKTSVVSSLGDLFVHT